MGSITRIVEVPHLPARPRAGHKGTFGHVLVVAGSRGMSGAAVLCGSAALRAGAGTVQVAVPKSIQAVVAASQPCYTTAGLPDTDESVVNADAAEVAVRLAERADAIAVGPGLGRGQATIYLVREIVRAAKTVVVVDADGLFAFCDPPVQRGAAPVILTPHPGEFAALLGRDSAEVQAQREKLATEFAFERGVILVLKGADTLVTDGLRLYVNRTGNPGMATGGSGDVLTGTIAAIAAQGLAPFNAAVLGVHAHGLAGDLARDEFGEVSLIATDLIAALPHAFQRLRPAG